MTAALDEQVPISLPKGTLLVLFEFLARSSDRWRPSENRQQAEDRFVLKPDPGELAALWHFEGAIERTLPEVFAPDYQNTIDGWKQKLRSQVGL